MSTRAFKTTLKKAMNASDTEYVNGYLINLYSYQNGFDQMDLELSDGSTVSFDALQEIEVAPSGAKVRDMNGDEHNILFLVHRPLEQSDVR